MLCTNSMLSKLSHSIINCWELGWQVMRLETARHHSFDTLVVHLQYRVQSLSRSTTFDNQVRNGLGFSYLPISCNKYVDIASKLWVKYFLLLYRSASNSPYTCCIKSDSFLIKFVVFQSLQIEAGGLHWHNQRGSKCHPYRVNHVDFYEIGSIWWVDVVTIELTALTFLFSPITKQVI